MPRHPETVVTPNTLLVRARTQLSSPQRAGQCMSRSELADAVNTALDRLYPRRNLSALYVDHRWIGKLERGEHRWPSPERRAALRHVLGTADDADLGLYSPRRTARTNQTTRSGASVRDGDPWDTFPAGLDDVNILREADEVRTVDPVGDLTAVLTHVTEIVVRGTVTVPPRTRIMELLPPTSMEVPRRVGAADVARIEAATSAFRDWDNRWGGGLSRAAVVAQLQWVAMAASRSVCTSQAVRSRLLTALADLAGVAAFLSYDMNHHAHARALWMLGLDAASEAGNVDLVGTTLRQLAHQCLHLDRPDDALRLVRLAYATTVNPRHHVSELALAEIAAYEGWCFAVAGKLQPCHRALGRAQEHFANADGEVVPPWLSHLDAAELTALRGHSYHVLAHRIPEVVGDAQRLLRQAVAGRGSAYARSRTLNLIALSGTFFQACEDLEEGIAIGDQALDGADTLTSPRALDRLRALRTLTGPHAAIPAVAQFQRRIESVLTDA